MFRQAALCCQSRMKTVNLLEFLNEAHDLYTLDYAKCNSELINFLDLMTEDEQFTQNIDFGLIFVSPKSSDRYIIVDGLNRILSLSLLLHAVCECYKKTTERNEKAIKTIRTKYLVHGSGKSKLRLNESDSILYNKIINGERLSGHEKNTPMFILLHNFWSQIKEEKLQASKIFTMLKKVSVTLVDTDNVSKRNLYYKLNGSRNLNQILLIEDYLKENGIKKEWDEIKQKYFPNNDDIIQFLKDFFVTKFNYKKFNPERLYESFVNYFETMMQYMPEDVLMKRMKHSASLYYNILNVKFNSDEIKQAFIQIKMHSGEDTYAYILDVYNDFTEGNISETTFVEILNTIADYLKNRVNSENNMEFNELIQYLNAFITCK